MNDGSRAQDITHKKRVSGVFGKPFILRASYILGDAALRMPSTASLASSLFQS